MRAIRRWTLLALALALCASAAAAQDGYWQTLPEGGLACRESRPGCHLLQMVMSGSFSQLDAQDGISARVFSAVFPQLTALTQEDFDHFVAQFGTEAALLNRAYFIALGNCLLSDILLSDAHVPEEAAVRRVMRLFLDPQGEENAAQQIAAIRAAMSEEVLGVMAQSTGLPLEAVRYLVKTDDWRVLEAAAP